jgi:branched-chain amino acid transport system substrate-binding protein
MSKMQGGRMLAAWVWPFVLAAVLSGCKSAVPETVKIGVAAALSGPSANRGQDLLNGAQMAADEINAAGFRVNGKPIRFEIVPKDDKADNDTAKQVAQELVDQHVHAVIAHTNSPQLQAAMPIYVAHRTLMLSTTTQRTLIDQGQGHLFRLVPNDRVQARALASFSTDQLEGRRVVAVVESTDYGREMYGDMVQALKEKNREAPEKIDVEFKKPVDDDVAQRIKAMKADVVVLIGREQHGLSLMERLKSAQYADVKVVATNPIRTDRVAKSDIPVRAFYTTSTTITLSELPAGEAFKQRFVSQFKSEPVWGAHYTYDAVYALADTIRRTGSVDSQVLAAKLRTIELNTRIFHQMRFSPTGEQAHPAIGIYKAERGGWSPQVRSSNW